MKARKVLAAALTMSMVAGMTMAAPVSASSFSTGELQVNIWDNNQLAGLQEIADAWSAETGVKVTINVVDWDNYWTLLEAGASGGQMPDVFWMHSNT
ncbi:MAG: extracellular solute-binding protein, partial [Lachnospiraceae bacterium]|nr:extracellular solute-binding protein [Lachnospiraceae bacterium]